VNYKNGDESYRNYCIYVARVYEVRREPIHHHGGIKLKVGLWPHDSCDGLHCCSGFSNDTLADTRAWDRHKRTLKHLACRYGVSTLDVRAALRDVRKGRR